MRTGRRGRLVRLNSDASLKSMADAVILMVMALGHGVIGSHSGCESGILMSGLGAPRRRHKKESVCL